jgi:hypothetical protein
VRITVDEADVDEDIVTLVARLEKVSPSLVAPMSPALDEMKKAIQYVALAGVSRPIFFHPLMISGHNAYFKDGICFEVVRRSRRGDILAAGGRLVNVVIDITKSSNYPPIDMTTLSLSSLCRNLAVTMYLRLGCKSPSRRSSLLWLRTRRFL